MWLKWMAPGVVGVSLSLSMIGCGGHREGVATGVDEPPAPQTQEEINVEMQNDKALKGQ